MDRGPMCRTVCLFTSQFTWVQTYTAWDVRVNNLPKLVSK